VIMAQSPKWLVAAVLVGAAPVAADLLDCPRRPDVPASAALRTWRISSSYAAISENDGHTAITRPVNDGSATATLAARLATLPTASSALAESHLSSRSGTRPAVSIRIMFPRMRRRRDDHPVNGQWRQRRHPAGCRCSSTSRCMCRYDTVPAFRALTTDRRHVRKQRVLRLTDAPVFARALRA